MLHNAEALKGQNHIQYSLTIPEEFPLQAKRRPMQQTVSVSERALEPHEIQLSGSQVLIAWASALGTITLLIWAFVRLWLFEG